MRAGKVPIYTGNPDLWNPLDPSFKKEQREKAS
jgi:hypothetical protein